MMRWCANIMIFVLCLLFTAGLASPQSPGALGAEGKKGTIWYIPHTHWEGAVFKTREEYLEMGLPIILRALNMLKRHPAYKFTFDQAAFIKPFPDRYPEAGRNEFLLVFSRSRQPAGPLGVPVAGHRRNEDCRLLASLRLCRGLRIARQPSGIRLLLSASLRRTQTVCEGQRHRGTRRS